MSITHEINPMADATIHALLNYDITESYSKLDTIKSLAPLWEKDYGINPLKLYCNRTGREVGTLNDSILHSSLSSIKSDDTEEIMDELISRCLLSMRPAPDLIYLSGDSMKALIDHDATTALIFYLSKAFESQNRQYMAVSPTHKSSRFKHKFASDESAIEAKINWNRGLVELQQIINQNIPQKNIKRFCLMLLSIDAQLGLHKLTPPSELWGFGLITKQHAFSDCIKLIKHYKNELTKIEKANKGFLDNVNTLSLHTAQAIRKEIGRKKSPIQRKKERNINNFAIQLADLIDGNKSIDLPKPAVAKVIQKAIRRTGIKITGMRK